MGIKKEFFCKGHGNFESTKEKPKCPVAGCDTVERVFLTPVGLASDRTKGIDRTVESLAKSYGMTDINNRGGQAAKRQSASNERRNEEYKQFLKERFGDGWGAVPKGGTMRSDSKEIIGSGAGPAAALAQYHGAPENNFATAKELFVPKPVLVKHDHENLSVSDARPPA